jgi:hypothetical protein
MCSRPFDLSVLPIFVTRVPAAPFARCFPRTFTLITRTVRACVSYHSCVALYPRDSRVFYVADPIKSPDRSAFS